MHCLSPHDLPHVDPKHIGRHRGPGQRGITTATERPPVQLTSRTLQDVIAERQGALEQIGRLSSSCKCLPSVTSALVTMSDRRMCQPIFRRSTTKTKVSFDAMPGPCDCAP